MMRSIRPLGALAVLLLWAMPALAVNNFRMPTDSKIDLVRDLPNDPTFEHDGQYYDLGYLYSTERVNGVDVARSGQGFVLYHDDRYIKLDAAQLQTVTMVLGEDPTAEYVPPVAKGPGIGGESARDGGREPAIAQPESYRPTARRSSGGIGIAAVVLLFIVLAMVRFMMRSAVRAMLAPLFGRRQMRQPLAIASADPFASRVSARLAEIENEAAAAAAAAAPPPSWPVQPAPLAATPAARGFGRKGL